MKMTKKIDKNVIGTQPRAGGGRERIIKVILFNVKAPAIQLRYIVDAVVINGRDKKGKILIGLSQFL
jgi:hypothetical protein